MSGDRDDLTVDRLTADVTRIETVEDGKRHGYHLLDGRAGPVVLDSGFAAAPERVYAPVLAERDTGLDDIQLAVITHADADHFGGNHALRSANPSVSLACHRADARWVESVERAMAERYGGFEADHGVTYDAETLSWLRSIMGPDEPVDWNLTGGEHLNLAESTLEVVHTPGHSPGHLMAYDRAADVLLGADGVFGRGLVDTDGTFIQPPPYFDRDAYLRTIDLVEALDPELVSWTHYDVMDRDALATFIAESRAFVRTLDRFARDLLDAHDAISLAEAIEATADRVGTFGFKTDLAIPLSAHFDALVDCDEADAADRDGRVVWHAATG